jgi:hypothetical protein
MRVRVLNKTKEGVTFTNADTKAPPLTTTWDDFNKVFKPTFVPFIYESDSELDKVTKEKIAMLQEVMPTILMARVGGGDSMRQMANMMVLGEVSEKYCKKFNCAPIDFLNDYKMFEKAMFEKMMDDGIGIGKIHRDFHGMKGKDTKREPKKPEVMMDSSDKCSIGDMIKAKREKNR